MTKIFCDLCSNEITEENTNEGKSVERYLTAETTYQQRKKVVIGITTNTAFQYGRLENVAVGHYCRYCLLDALQELDKRPKTVVVV